MNGFTFAEKALARAAGVAPTHAGEVLDVTPNVIFSHDNSAAIRRIFEQMGAERIAHPERVVITLDHAAPAPTTQHAQNHQEIREWVQMQGIRHFFEVGRGIGHQVMSEEGLALPGETIFGADSHTTHFGWVGAFGMGVGRTEVAALWATGTLWIQVPESVQVVLTGTLPTGVTAKDVALHLLSDLTVAGGEYRAIEFVGDVLERLPLDERPVLPNMMAEFGAMSAYLPPDEVIFDYLEPRRQRDYQPLYPDNDATYALRHTIDVNQLEPLIAFPHQPDHVYPLSHIGTEPIQQAFIGTCTGGRYSDLAAAAQVLKGQKVSVRTIVIPASSQILLKAAQTGILEILLNAGVTIATPGCGPCMGNHLGIPAPHEATISTGSRNFRGRMGTGDAPIFLANPYVVAASAVLGRVAHPQEVL